MKYPGTMIPSGSEFIIPRDGGENIGQSEGKTGRNPGSADLNALLVVTKFDVCNLPEVADQSLVSFKPQI